MVLTVQATTTDFCVWSVVQVVIGRVTTALSYVHDTVIQRVVAFTVKLWIEWCTVWL